MEKLVEYIELEENDDLQTFLEEMGYRSYTSLESVLFRKSRKQMVVMHESKFFVRVDLKTYLKRSPELQANAISQREFMHNWRGKHASKKFGF